MSSSGWPSETGGTEKREEASELGEGEEMGELFGGDVDLDKPAGEQLGDTGGRVDEQLAGETPGGGDEERT